jgi:uncharacterized protein (DUF1330 family)
MAAYLIVYREGPVRDEAAMLEYRSHTAKLPGNGSSLIPLVVHGAIHALEGAPPEGVVLLQFPSVAEARAWYESPAYQAALPHRLRAAEYRTIIVEGIA